MALEIESVTIVPHFFDHNGNEGTTEFPLHKANEAPKAADASNIMLAGNTLADAGRNVSIAQLKYYIIEVVVIDTAVWNIPHVGQSEVQLQVVFKTENMLRPQVKRQSTLCFPGIDPKYFQGSIINPSAAGSANINQMMARLTRTTGIRYGSINKRMRFSKVASLSALNKRSSLKRGV